MSISTISDIIKKVKMDNPYDETEAFKSSYKLRKILCDNLNYNFIFFT
jgi:hypothetical protein